jgi:hypothetical protein
MFSVRNDVRARTIHLTLNGTIRDAELRQCIDQMRAATDAYHGTEHMVLADMRGMAALPPDVSALMGETMAYQRRRGVVLCAHLSDSSIIRLQAKRLAREAQPDDKATVEVVSLEEAQRVLAEARPGLKARRAP